MPGFKLPFAINSTRVAHGFVSRKTEPVVAGIFGVLGDAKLRGLIERWESLSQQIPANGILQWQKGDETYSANINVIKQSYGRFLGLLSDDDLMAMVPFKSMAIIDSYGPRGKQWLKMFIEDIRKFSTS